MLRVQELMTGAVESLREGDSIEAALIRMERERIRHFPVTDAEGRLQGVVSERDLFRALSRGTSASAPLASVMVHAPPTVQVDTLACRAVELMLDEKLGVIPVVDEHRRVLGILTETDFLYIAHQALHGRTGADLLRV